MERKEVIRRLKNRVDDGRSSSAEAVINLIDALYECGLAGFIGCLDLGNQAAVKEMVSNPEIAKELYQYLRSSRVHKNL
jgi:hypothetical protein